MDTSSFKTRKQRCDFSSSNYRKDSTKKDLIIGSILGDTAGYLAFIYTLEATQTEATVIILTDDDTLSKLPKVKANLRLSVISIGTRPLVFTRAVSAYKFILFEFLVQNSHLFRRILVTDVSDVVFQEDPFEEYPIWDKLYFAFEYFRLNEQPTNLNWVRNITGWMLKDEFETELANCGLIAGNSKMIETLSRLVLYVWKVELLWDTNDQGVINYNLLNDFIQDAGLDYATKDRVHLGVFKCGIQPLAENFPYFPQEHSDDVSSILHKYNYFERTKIIEKCSFYNSPDAVRIM